MKNCKKIVIVGGVAGGASAAARARRLSEEAEIILVERGEHISFANCGLPYHIGSVIRERDRLLIQTPESLKRRFGIEVRIRTEALRIDRARRELVLKDLVTGVEKAESYEALILSPGAAPVRPPVPGLDNPRVLTLRNMADMDAIIRVLETDKPDHAVVMGGGYIGLEMAEALRERKLAVALVEMTGQVMGPVDPEMAVPLHQELIRNGVDLRLNSTVSAIRPADRGLDVELTPGAAIRTGLVIVATGVKPDVALARAAGLEIGPSGGIVVDDRMRTSDPAIFAVGDAVEVTDFVGGFKTLIPLAGPANRQGRIAADAIFGRDSVYRKTQGTAICKVFGLAIGMTGLSEKMLKKTGRAHEKIYIHAANHAGYYPNGVSISLKLLFEPANGNILGAQAVGADGVDKRIDVIAMALRGGLTVRDLADAELAYAPPYGSAKDPVNIAGFVASNVLRGDMRLCHSGDLLAPKPDQAILDVRTPGECKAGTIPGSVNIPVDQLRERLAELPRDKELLVYCQVGLRGYLACRILVQRGFRCRNLTGGYKTFQMATASANPTNKGGGR
ncbi:MAG: pyridine nucleotide-disulfide oxidoreductase family protein [Lentisphaerae bacterium]|nr:pyridine nucleotide-disulfide oxidoreductase family protein [Lentisphaerota bacterium]